MSMDPNWLLLSSLFSLIGFAVFTYGRKQRTGTHIVFGVVLMAYPYFIRDLLALVLVGVLLIVGMVVVGRMENG